MLKFFKNPFAIIGTRAPIPATDPGTGEVNYPTGFTPQYQLPKTDPLSRNIPRDQTNQLYFDLTNELSLLQAHGVPDFITTALNEGVPKAYSVGDRVRYDNGVATRVYESRINANTDLPTVTASWRIVQAGTPQTTAGGTANALTAAFTPSLFSLPNGSLFLLEHINANSGAATLAVDGGSALPIVKANDAPLIAGDIPGANSWGLYCFDSSLAKFVLLTVGGLPGATNAEAQAAAVSNRAVTPANLAAVLLGVGQTWTNVGGSRVFGTNYTNATSRTIQVNVNVSFPSGSAAEMLVGGVVVSRGASGGASTESALSAPVGPGGVYRVNSVAGTPAFSTWMELR